MSFDGAAVAEREQLDEVLAELQQAGKLLLTTHQNPDGDALGSLLGMHHVLTALGKDSVMFLDADQFPLPYEYRHMAFEGLLNAPPEDVEDRLLVFLDCATIKRMPVEFAQREGARIVNIDHHHDNTSFGTLNLVMPKVSCTAEIVHGLAKRLHVEITPAIAVPLYIGLVTDTGRFMFENTTPEAHRMAAELIEVGVQAHEVYRDIYENLPEGRLLLLARALASIQRFDGGTLTLTHLTREDFEETGCDEADSEGIVDYFRAVEGTAVGALVRARLSNGGEESRKVSLRATDGRVDVSLIARGFEGGGHRQAAGFFSDLPLPELVERLRTEIGAQL